MNSKAKESFTYESCDNLAYFNQLFSFFLCWSVWSRQNRWKIDGHVETQTHNQAQINKLFLTTIRREKKNIFELRSFSVEKYSIKKTDYSGKLILEI